MASKNVVDKYHKHRTKTFPAHDYNRWDKIKVSGTGDPEKDGVFIITEIENGCVLTIERPSIWLTLLKWMHKFVALFTCKMDLRSVR